MKGTSITLSGQASYNPTNRFPTICILTFCTTLVVLDRFITAEFDLSNQSTPSEVKRRHSLYASGSSVQSSFTRRASKTRTVKVYHCRIKDCGLVAAVAIKGRYLHTGGRHLQTESGWGYKACTHGQNCYATTFRMLNV